MTVLKFCIDTCTTWSEHEICAIIQISQRGQVEPISKSMAIGPRLSVPLPQQQVQS